MITANELRVGNFVQGDELSIPRLNLYHDGVTKMTGYGIHMIELGNITSLNAIPLTDEILLKAGFKELNYGWYAKEYFTDCNEAAEVMSIQYNLTTGRCGIGDTDFGGCNAMTGKVFHSLHQLQNLVYSLTGSELEVVW